MCLGGFAQFDPKPKAFRVGTDLTNLGYTFFANNWTQYEFNADLEVASFFLVADYGILDRTWEDTNYKYNTNGNYARVGLDHNFFAKKEGDDVFFIGLRYGWSNYSEVFDTEVFDPVWGTSVLSESNQDVSARWFEAVLGLKVKIWKQLFLGMTGRLKLARKVTGDESLVSFEIPGYGRAAESSYWGWNYNLYWRFPFKKAEQPPPEE